MSFKDSPNAPLAGLTIAAAPGAAAAPVQCLSDGGRIKAYVTAVALVVMRPQPLELAGDGDAAGTAARNASDLGLRTRADEEVLRIALADVTAVRLSVDGKTLTVTTAAGPEATMSFSSKWSVKRLVAALPALAGGEGGGGRDAGRSGTSAAAAATTATATAASGGAPGTPQQPAAASIAPRPPMPDLSGVCAEVRELHAHRAAVWEELRRYYNDDSSYGVLTQRDHALQCAHQAAEAHANPRVVVGALLHDVGWKLARADPSAEVAMTDGAAAAVSQQAPEAGCLAAQMGILSHCGIVRAGDGDGDDSGGGGSGGEAEAETSAAVGAEQLRAQHDVIGGCWLRMRGFHEDVAHVVEGHVLAKRYLCHVEPEYYGKLSAGSKKTLAFQGGPMTAEEAAVFERDPLQPQCLALRRWDEGAKRVGWAVPDLDAYKELVLSSIVRLPTEAGARVGTFLRNGNVVTGLVSEQKAAAKAAAEAAAKTEEEDEAARPVA